jgi:hypothetical protein
LQYADSSLKEDRVFLLKAIKKNKDILKYISDELKEDEDFYQDVLQIYPNINYQNYYNQNNYYQNYRYRNYHNQNYFS